MTYKEILDKLNEIHVYKTKLLIFLKNHHLDLYNEILKNTMFLPDSSTFAERIYCIKNDIHARILCPVCKKNFLNFCISNGKYHSACSQKCSRIDPVRRKKAEETSLSRYGLKHYVNIELSRKTRYEKSGGKWNYADFAIKAKQTRLQKYGNENYVNPEKTIQTNMKRYGVPYPVLSPEVIKKIKHTTMLHYGVESYGQTEESIKCRIIGLRHRSWKYIMQNIAARPLCTEEYYVNHTVQDEFDFECLTCHTKFKSRWDNGGLVEKCPTCYPKEYGKSNIETEISSFISTFYSGEIIKNDRTIIAPKELDIYIPDKHIAIEIDGVFYHSEYFKSSRSYHIKKTKQCKKCGIRLIHVFEDEWIYKQDIVKSRIRHILGCAPNRIYARNCVCKKLDYKDVDLFVDKNHLQGSIKTSANYGLFYNDELVAAMTFSKPRFNKKHEWELVRFCAKLDTSIIGGASKLLTRFISDYDPKSIVSYADVRWSDGELYKTLGFKLVNISEPNYFYVHPPKLIRYSRVRFQKHKLPSLLSNYNNELSESVNMLNNGYYKLYDCGNYVFEMNR